MILLVGHLAGWLAGQIVRGPRFCIIGDMAIGIVGAFLSGDWIGYYRVLVSHEALAAAKARGVKLGGDRGYCPVAAPDARLGGDAVRRDADHAAHQAMVVIVAIRVAHGPDVSLHAVARGLTERQVATPRGGAWTATAVRRVFGTDGGIGR